MLYNQIFENNKRWVAEKKATDEQFFEHLAEGQSPTVLYIGCSDSRVTVEELTGVKPGEMFVHRNIANLVPNNDNNSASVVLYAVEHLHVEQIVICGHYGCGGIKASMTNNDHKAVLNMWLRSIKDVYRHNREELDQIENMDKRADRLSELNVMEQVVRLSQTTIVQNAWLNRNEPHLHGWIYGLNDGLIKPVMELKAGSEIDPLYRYDNIN